MDSGKGESGSTVFENISNQPDLKVQITKYLVKRLGLFVAAKNEMTLNIPQCIATCDHFKGGTNALLCVKQALETFVPDLKGVLFPSRICTKVSALEKDGYIPSSVYNINCIITKAGNKRGMYTFYYSSQPAALLANMLR